MLANSLFADPVDFTAGMRPNDPEHFYGTDATGKKINFITKIHQDTMKPKMQKMLYTRKVDKLTAEERSSQLFTGDQTKSVFKGATTPREKQ